MCYAPREYLRHHCCPSSPLSGPIGRAKPLKTRAPVAIAETRPPVLADAVPIGAGLVTAIGRDPWAQLKPSRRRSRHPEASPSATRDHGAVQVAIRRNLIWTRVMLTILNLPDPLRRVRTETRPDPVPTQGRPAPPPLHRAPRRVDRTRRSEFEDTRRRDPRGVRAAPPDVHVPGHLTKSRPTGPLVCPPIRSAPPRAGNRPTRRPRKCLRNDTGKAEAPTPTEVRSR